MSRLKSGIFFSMCHVIKNEQKNVYMICQIIIPK